MRDKRKLKLIRKAMKEHIPKRAYDLWQAKYQFVDTRIKMQNGTPTIEISGPLLSILDSDLKFAEALAEIGPKTDFRMNINSPGGEVPQAIAMRARMDEHEGKIVAHVMGMAASAAQYITLSADKVRMAPGSEMMIHLPHGLNMTYGTADMHEKVSMRLVADLRKMEMQVIEDLGTRLDLSEKEIRTLLEDETYLTAEEAVEIGLADEVYPKRKSKGSTGGDKSEMDGSKSEDDVSDFVKQLRAISARMKERK